MKYTVMSYLDNLIAWGDNLFSTESREALSEATLLYVIASEILGPTPVAVTPPQHADESFDQLEPSLDAFANAMVEIENVIGGAGGTGGASGRLRRGRPAGAQTFYFKIPSNEQFLGYWTTVADRLYKLRHCQNIAGAPLQLALFDAPIDPGLLIAAQAAGVDLSSVLSDVRPRCPTTASRRCTRRRSTSSTPCAPTAPPCRRRWRRATRARSRCCSRRPSSSSSATGTTSSTGRCSRPRATSTP